MRGTPTWTHAWTRRGALWSLAASLPIVPDQLCLLSVCSAWRRALSLQAVAALCAMRCAPMLQDVLIGPLDERLPYPRVSLGTHPNFFSKFRLGDTQISRKFRAKSIIRKLSTLRSKLEISTKYFQFCNVSSTAFWILVSMKPSTTTDAELRSPARWTARLLQHRHGRRRWWRQHRLARQARACQCCFLKSPCLGEGGGVARCRARPPWIPPR